MASTKQNPFPARWFPWAFAGVVAVFGAVRFACACNDLWLDEIWSLRLVQQLHSPAEILTRLWHDNNHPLNSLWLYILGSNEPSWAYRLLSWAAGTASVGLAGAIGRRLFRQLYPDALAAQAEVAALITATLVGGCYFLIHFSSEARGYGPAVGFSFLAVYALSRASTRPVDSWASVYGLACVLGLLSHLVAFQVMFGGLVWSALTIFKRWSSWRDRLIHLAGWQLWPWLFLGFYYLGFVRKVEIGGGPKLALVEVIGTLSAFCLGFPDGKGGVAALLVFLVTTLLSLGLVWRRDHAIAGFYLGAIFVAPVVVQSFSRFGLLYPRYFIVSAALALLLLGYGLVRLWDFGRFGRLVTIAMLGVLLAGNGWNTLRLLQDGRGQYQAALRYVAALTPTDVITVSSDSDFRNFGVMDYYKSAVGPNHHLQYYPSGQGPLEGLQWIFVHRLDESTPVPPDALHDAAGHNYRLARVFPHAPLSGWEWYAYRQLNERAGLPARY